MANAFIHAKSSAHKHGGVMSDYVDIHEFMDSSKLATPSNQHRVLTHNNWFVCNVLPRVFGDVRVNSAGKEYSVRQIGIDHCLEDFRMKFVPTAQDYIDHMENPLWMNNAMGDDVPNSVKNMRRPKDVAGEESFELGPVVGKD